MAKFRRYLTVILVVLGLGAPGVRAQEATDPNATISVKFTVFAPRAVKGMVYFSEGDKKPPSLLKFYNSYRSPVYDYEGGSVLRFYDEAEVAAALTAYAAAQAAASPGQVVPKPVLRPTAVCAIPAGATKVFLLFMPRPGAAIGGFKYDIFVMDDGETSVPPGHFVMINASKMEMFARINGNDTKILRGVSAPIKADKDLVIFMAARIEPEYHKLLIADTWDLGPRQRNLLIFFPPRTATALLPDVVRLNDEVPEEKKK